MKKLYWMIPFILLLLLPLVVDRIQNEEIIYQAYKVSGKITDKNTIQKPLEIVLKNNDAANNEDIEAYLDTLSKENRAATEKELLTFFEEYEIKHEIVGMHVLKQTEDRTVIEVVKIAKNHNEKEFQDHQSSNVLTLERINDEWFIVESLINKTKVL